jgi:DNA-binding PadR family transcriptional regulator
MMVEQGDARGAERAPLKPVLYEILLAIGCGAAHGYAIRQDVEARTGGAIRLWPTTLYGSLRQLREDGLVEELDAEQQDARGKRLLRLTPAGIEALEAETRRLEALTRLARTRSVLAE